MNPIFKSGLNISHFRYLLITKCLHFQIILLFLNNIFDQFHFYMLYKMIMCLICYINAFIFLLDILKYNYTFLFLKCLNYWISLSFKNYCMIGNQKFQPLCFLIFLDTLCYFRPFALQLSFSLLEYPVLCSCPATM